MAFTGKVTQFLVLFTLAVLLVNIDLTSAQYGLDREAACGTLCGHATAPTWYGQGGGVGARCRHCQPGCCCCDYPDCWDHRCGK